METWDANDDKEVMVERWDGNNVRSRWPTPLCDGVLFPRGTKTIDDGGYVWNAAMARVNSDRVGLKRWGQHQIGR